MNPYYEGYNPCIDDEWSNEEHFRRKHFKPIEVKLLPPWGDLPETYPGQHQGKSFGPITGGWLKEEPKKKEDEIDKTYYPYYGPRTEKDTLQHEQLKEFLAKDKPIIEALWEEHQKKVEEFNKIWFKK